jgi:hypothetical protein
MVDAEMVEQGFLRGDDVADRDVGKIRTIDFAGLRVDAAVVASNMLGSSFGSTNAGLPAIPNGMAAAITARRRARPC